MMIIGGAAAAAIAFHNRLPEVVHGFQGTRVHQGSLLEHYALECGLSTSCMLPIFLPRSRGSCIGVIEYSMSTPWSGLEYLKQLNKALEEVGLRMYHAQESIPYKTIAGLKPARDEIEKALKIVCPSHNISLVQVWIASEDKYCKPFSSLLEDTEKKQTFAFKMTGYCADVDSQGFRWVYNEYYDFCDMFPLKMGDGIIDRTLEDYKPRFCKCISKLSFDNLMRILTFDGECSGLVICLRSIGTGDLTYVFEFIWPLNSNYVIFLEALLLTLKRCLPNFKFASGAELDDELYVINVKNSTRSENNFIKIFQGNRIPSIPDEFEKVKRKRVVEDFIGFSETKGKTDPILLRREVIERQFGNTMKEAAKNLNVSLSTLKRKCKDSGIREWQGPQHVAKRKVNEEDNRAIQYPSAVNRNENTLTIKADNANDTIKFHLRISQATFATVRNEISKRFKLTLGTYQLKYLDEDGDWILLISDQDMSDCIKTLKNLNRTVLRLRVVPYAQTLSGPIGSNDISCT